MAGLDRTATGFDTDSALSAVDLRKMQERAEVMQLGGQLLFKGVGDLGGYLSQKAETKEGKVFWADGGKPDPNRPGCGYGPLFYATPGEKADATQYVAHGI
ncbi:hypothetical protein [Stenotrophomonas maltophilia]|uniref:hypothetical protein n=1 Tax=Stenotrophomonas maltophilia TaxID=40324 RepID=UPI002B1DE3C9|nr:hypothetical protein [Stenotrophomonas maltophilia]